MYQGARARFRVEVLPLALTLTPPPTLTLTPPPPLTLTLALALPLTLALTLALTLPLTLTKAPNGDIDFEEYARIMRVKLDLAKQGEAYGPGFFKEPSSAASTQKVAHPHNQPLTLTLTPTPNPQPNP